MRRPLKYVFSLLILSQVAWAQSEEDGLDSLVTEIKPVEAPAVEKTPSDSLSYPMLSSVSVLYDYGKLAGMLLETESKQEVGAQIEFKNKIVLVGEYGLAVLEPNGAYQNAEYVSSGYYYRVGAGYKISMKAKNNFIFTFRYGQSFYSDEGNISIHSPTGIYDSFVEPFDREETKADWFEVVMSSETRMWKGLFLGFHLRLRIMNDYVEREPLDVYSIPGYGRTIDKTIPALNLYVRYAIEWF